jgi:hypothetical protein
LISLHVVFHDGVSITEEVYSSKISGRYNNALARALFREFYHDKATEFMDRKEAIFRKYLISSYLHGSAISYWL